MTYFSAHKLIRMTLVFHILLLMLSTCFTGASAVASEDTEQLRRQEKMRIEREIERSQVKIQRLQSGLEDQQEGIEETQLQKRGILSELQDLDERLNTMAGRLVQLEERMITQKKLIHKKELQLQEVRKKSEKVQLHMQKRIGAYYKLGKIDLVNITFSTQTLPELLRFHDAFETVIEYDKELMNTYQATIDELEGAKEALTLEQGLLEEFIAQAAEEEQRIRAARKDKARLLNRVKTQAALHQQAIKEIKKATMNLSTALLTMRKKEKLYDQGFLLNKGRHIPPVAGTVTSRFNEERVNQFGITRKPPGITIVAPDGANVQAIYDGTVIHAGYLKGFGNSVIIDHGYQYFTITSRIERMLVSNGANVKRNDIIGITGSTATIMDDGLYFEIRHKDIPQDPLQWLDNDALSFD